MYMYSYVFSERLVISVLTKFAVTVVVTALVIVAAFVFVAMPVVVTAAAATATAGKISAYFVFGCGNIFPCRLQKQTSCLRQETVCGATKRPASPQTVAAE